MSREPLFDWGSKAATIFADSISKGELPAARTNETSRKYAARLKSEGFEGWAEKISQAAGTSLRAVKSAASYKPKPKRRKRDQNPPTTPNPPRRRQEQAEATLSERGKLAARLVGEEFLALHEEELIDFALEKMAKDLDS